MNLEELNIILSRGENILSGGIYVKVFNGLSSGTSLKLGDRLGDKLGDNLGFNCQDDLPPGTDQDADQDTDQDTDQDALQDIPQETPQDTPQVLKLIKILDNSYSRDEIQELPGLSDREYVRKMFINPSLNQDLIEMTIPDKPNSKHQKYRLTTKGITMKNKWIQEESLHRPSVKTHRSASP